LGSGVLEPTEKAHNKEIGNMMSKFRIAIGLLAAGLCLVPIARGESSDAPEPAAPTTAEEAAKADELAKMLANPVANLWSMQFQFNNFELTNGRWNYNLIFQPVMPVSLTKDINLITRPVVQLYNSVPYETSTGADARTTNFGDWTQLELFSPADSGKWLLGAGPTFIFPTAGSVYTGQGKFQVGPALVVAYMSKKFILGVFPQQWWSYAGDPTRPNTSQINIQPIAAYFLEGGWSVGYSGNITASWKAPSDNRWTVPIGVAVSKVVKFGRLPVKIGLAGQYMVMQPDPVGQRWNIQLSLTPVLPKLIKGTLFE
jgi:hypothetical protein